jgi:hypothetical protein
MWLMRLWRLFLILAFLFAGLLTACGDDDDDDDSGDDDTADDDDDDNDTSPGDTWPGDQTVVVVTPDGEFTVSLNGLPMEEWTDPETSDVHPAVPLIAVVDKALEDSAVEPNDYKFNFVATDDYDILAKKLDGDYRALPFYDDLALGWFIEYDETGEKYIDIEIVWDESLGFENFMKAKLMDGGTIGMVENVLFDQDVTVNVVWGPTKAKTAVNLNGLPAFDDEGTLAIWVHHIILEGALEGFNPKERTYAFNFVANDGYDLLDDDTTLLDLPVWLDYDTFKDVHHGWIENTAEDGYRIFWDEATGFPGNFSMKFMEDGTIEAYDITDL